MHGRIEIGKGSRVFNVAFNFSGTRFAVFPPVLSPEFLNGNLAALTRAQGRCPTLGALPASMRVAVAGNHVQLELRTTDEQWQLIDEPWPQRGLSWMHSGGVAGADQLVAVGVGLGYGLAARTGVKRVIAIEPHPGVATLFLSMGDWRQWFEDGRLRLVTGPDYQGAADFARLLDGLEDIAVVAHPLRARWEQEVIARATAVATRVAQNAKANGNARRRFAGPYLLQTLANLTSIAREADVQALDDDFRGVPAVVVGAGPSLDENREELRALQDRALIVTADTALGPLVSCGVRPHLAVAVDSSELNARHVTTVADVQDVALAAEGSVHPSALRHFAGRIFTFRVADHEPWPWLRAARVARSELKTWGSVLTSAFNLARRMGCDPIVFAGADLAFTGMRPYCHGTIYDAMWQEWIDKGCSWEALMAEYFSRQPELWRDDVHGAATRTGPHLVSFRDWLVEQTANGKGRFINATGAGILHGGRIELARLADALAEAPRVGADLHRRVRACHAKYTRTSGDVARVAQLLRAAHDRPSFLPLDRWKQFAVNTVTDDQMLAAVRGGQRAAAAS